METEATQTDENQLTIMDIFWEKLATRTTQVTPEELSTFHTLTRDMTKELL